jgi:hypothetical protein
VQAYCKNLPSDHGQRAGISKLNPRRLGDSLSLLALQADAQLMPMRLDHTS